MLCLLDQLHMACILRGDWWCLLFLLLWLAIKEYRVGQAHFSLDLRLLLLCWRYIIYFLFYFFCRRDEWRLTWVRVSCTTSVSHLWGRLLLQKLVRVHWRLLFLFVEMRRVFIVDICAQDGGWIFWFVFRTKQFWELRTYIVIVGQQRLNNGFWWFFWVDSLWSFNHKILDSRLVLHRNFCLWLPSDASLIPRLNLYLQLHRTVPSSVLSLLCCCWPIWSAFLVTFCR